MKIRIKKESLAGIKNLVKELKSYSENGFQDELAKTAAYAVNRAVIAAKVDTGNLSLNINYGREGDAIAIRSNAPYSPYVEFGTGRIVSFHDLESMGIPKEYAAQFKGKSQDRVHLPARPFFFNSIRKEVDELEQRVNNHFKNLTR